MTPRKIRDLLAVMLVFCQVCNPLTMWEKHKDSLSNDVKNDYPGMDVQQRSSRVYNKCVVLLDDATGKPPGLQPACTNTVVA